MRHKMLSEDASDGVAGSPCAARPDFFAGIQEIGGRDAYNGVNGRPKGPRKRA